MAKGKKTVFFCQNCGYESVKWMGQCPGCQQWNTFVEESVTEASSGKKQQRSRKQPVSLAEIQTEKEERTATGIGELDRVLGGGIVGGEHGAAAHEHVGPGRRHAPRRGDPDAAVHLDKRTGPRRARQLRDARHLLLAAPDVTLAREARLHAHDEHHVQIGQNRGERLDRRARLHARSRLRAAGVDELAYLVMTHPHADHIGGMPQVLESFDTGLLILPDLTEYDEESSALDRTLAAAADNGVPMYVALDGDTFALGGGTLTVLQAGEQPQNEGDAIDANNLSLCLRYTAGSFAFVDTGDAEADLEEQLVSRCGAGLQADLLKAGHHGSNTSNTQAFLDAISPQAVVAGCGLDNDYGHPHAEVVERVLAAGADFYRTDQDGAVTAVYDQNGLQIHCTADDSGALAPAA